MEVLKKWTEPRRDKGTRSKCLARCHCGDESVYLYDNLKSGNTVRCKSCSRKFKADLKLKHGLACKSKQDGGKTYYTWQAMKQRCLNENESRFERYGGRGIKVCDRWLESFENFIADMGEPPTGDHSIERIDNNGDYCKENCKWADRVEQARNKSNSRIVKAHGLELTLAEWADKTGILRETIARRLNNGWQPEHALSDKPDPIITPDGSFRSLSKAAKHYGMSISGIHARINSVNYPDWHKLEG